MNKVIYKYPLNEDKLPQIIEVPEQYKVLCLQLQNNKPYMWLMVDKETPMRKVKISTHVTGYEWIEWVKTKEYVGTYQEYGGQLVWHVFIEIA